jgi:hypothetical protein
MNIDVHRLSDHPQVAHQLFPALVRPSLELQGVERGLIRHEKILFAQEGNSEEPFELDRSFSLSQENPRHWTPLARKEK